ncbi:hypothetical protein [Rubellicoccus peritrichatus]|uniref:ABM domain-containing protein n=1 Tax=Rubellicoccus peritrichatus TaxID=3080537 RepID=A0AAQ3LCU4_9BACT|nr:hypothetical protein [Puniceicoccus sp. CR14]WOO43355.1 hypothetical protein RZN69_09670 [Puniceicoccus sp. CR14]
MKVHDGQLDAFKGYCEKLLKLTSNEPDCLFYGFSFDGNLVHCREGYKDADGLLAHIDNVGTVLEEALKIAEITRLEVHGPEAELAKLREPLSAFNPQYFVLEYGFRR